MQTTFHFMAPVETVRVTKENLQEVAEWCGGSIGMAESRRRPGTQDPYVQVNTPKGTRISWAFPGMIVTKRVVKTGPNTWKVSWAVFGKAYFELNYFETPMEAVDGIWSEYLNGVKTTEV